MNLLFYAPQMAAYGGMERHICDLAAACCRAGHSVRFLTTSNSLGSDLRSVLGTAAVDFRELGLARGRAGKVAKWLWLWKETLVARRSSWDLIYTNGQSGLASIVWQAGGANTRRVHHHHTAADLAEQATWHPSFRQVLHKAPELIACSHASRLQLNQAIGRRDTVFLPYLTRSPLQNIELQKPRPTLRPRFGFLGRLIPEKGIACILRLAQDPSLQDLEWHLHGAGAAYPESSFNGLSNVYYHGAYKADTLGGILLNLDAIVLFSSHNEGMPLSLLEALSAGLPWIATDRGGTGELACRPGETLLLPSSPDFETLRCAVRQLADRIRQGAIKRAALRSFYDQNFAPSLVAGMWLQYFLQTPAPNSQ